MSALPPKADMAQDNRGVRFVPKADSCAAAKGGQWRATRAFAGNCNYRQRGYLGWPTIGL